jgi:cyanate lyase
MTTTELISSEREAILSNVRSRMQEKGLTYTKLADTLGRNPMFVAAALHGQQKLNHADIDKVANLLGLDGAAKRELAVFPNRRNFPNTIDPFNYRLLEIIGVYGDAMREMFNELFSEKTGRGGDGIMSAIDFSIKMEKITGSHGEPRCKITLDGKYLEYKEF